MMVAASLALVVPELILAGGAIALLLWDLAARRSPRFCSLAGTTVALAALYALAAASPSGGGPAFMDMLVLDGLALAGRVLVLGALILVLLLSRSWLERPGVPPAEAVVLLLFAAVGLMGVVSANNFLVLFIDLEIAAVCTAALLGARREDPAGREAALKYFLLSAFAGAFLVFGFALFFSSRQWFQFSLGGWASPELQLALWLVVAGLAFKCALVPFHMWAPDVYEGGPTPVIAFLASASKAAGFLALARIVIVGDVAASGPFASQLLAAVAALSMVVGTALALTQASVKRMLAYSGVAHAGYALAAFTVPGVGALPELGAYLVAYAAATLGAFAVLAAAEADGVAPNLKGLAGYGRRSPLLAGALAVFMVSLTGLPPTAGFVAKFVVFREVLATGRLWLVVVAVAASVVSVGFYLRLLVPVFMAPAEEGEARPPHPPAEGVVIAAFLALLVLVLGCFPGALLAFGGLITAG